MTEQTQAETGSEAPAKTKPPKIEQNGVTRPKAGTTTGRVWEISDAISANTGKPAERGDVIAAGKAEGINEATLATQHGRWRKFHGLKGRAEKPKAPEAAPATATEPTAAPAAPETNGDPNVTNVE